MAHDPRHRNIMVKFIKNIEEMNSRFFKEEHSLEVEKTYNMYG